MVATFQFDVIGAEYVDIEIDDEEVEGMSEEEKIEYIQDACLFEATQIAECKCPYSIGDFSVTIDDDE